MAPVENLAIPVPDIRAAVIIAGHVLIFSGIAARRWPASAARIMRVDGENAVRAAGFLRLCLMWTGVSVMTAHIAMSFAGFSGGTLWVDTGRIVRRVFHWKAPVCSGMVRRVRLLFEKISVCAIFVESI